MSFRGQQRLAERDEESPSRLEWTGNGVVGGAIATVVMTAYRMPVTTSLPPSAEFWATYVAGGESDEYPVAALLLHLGYGAAAGGVFGVLFRLGMRDRLGNPDGDAQRDRLREAIGLLAGVGYGLALSVFGSRLLIARLLPMDLDPTERFVFHASHAVYGLSLGSWVAGQMTVDEITLD